MSRWHHVAAAGAGLCVSAIVVVVVFGLADQGGSTQEGQAPDVEARGGQCEPGGTPAQATLPPIFDARQRELRVTAPAHVRWLKRLNAAVGGCADEITVHARKIEVSASFPAETSDDDAARAAYSFLQRAFSPPLARSFAQLEVVQEDKRRTAFVALSAWNTIRQDPSYEASLEGLEQAREKGPFTDAELRLSGW